MVCRGIVPFEKRTLVTVVPWREDVENVVQAKSVKQVLDLLQDEVNEMSEDSCSGRLNWDYHWFAANKCFVV
jgi:hypothetical protein